MDRYTNRPYDPYAFCNKPIMMLVIELDEKIDGFKIAKEIKKIKGVKDIVEFQKINPFGGYHFFDGGLLGKDKKKK